MELELKVKFLKYSLIFLISFLIFLVYLFFKYDIDFEKIKDDIFQFKVSKG